MRLALWLRPLSRTLAVFLCLMFILGGALGWLGWNERRITWPPRFIKASQTLKLI